MISHSEAQKIAALYQSPGTGWRFAAFASGAEIADSDEFLKELWADIRRERDNEGEPYYRRQLEDLAEYVSDAWWVDS